MKKKDIDRLYADYPQWWDPKLADLPGGWTGLAADLFEGLDAINLGVGERKHWVLVKFVSYPSGGWQVYATPAVRMTDWTDGQALHLIRVLEVFNARVQSTCEVCGSVDAWLHKRQLGIGGPDRVLCEEHGREFEQEIARRRSP